MKMPSLFAKAGLIAICLSATASFAADDSDGSSFSGRISAVDASKNTVTVDGEKYQLLPTSRVTRTDTTASAKDLKAGQQIEGRYKTSAEDKREVLYVDIKKDSNMGAARDKATSESGATFQGRISRINRDAQTIRVGNRTYQILPTTTINRASGQTATLRELRQDQHVTGTYKESAEGKNELLTLEVGRQRNER